MTTELDTVSVAAAQALLDSVGEAKATYRAVDTAVANHLRNGSERAAEAVKPTIARAADTFAMAGVGAMPGFVGGAIGEYLSGWAGTTTTLLGEVPISENTFAVSALGMVVFGVTMWRDGGRKLTAAASAADRCDDFLFAGVALELAVGDLQTALADAGRGRPGAAEALADKVRAAQEAFEDYLTQLRQLDEKDVSVRFPWSSRKVDVELARELLTLDVETLLAEAELVATGNLTTEVNALPAPATRAMSRRPAGALQILITAAESLRSALTDSAETLKAVETTVIQRARRDAGAAAPDGDAPLRVAQAISQANVSGGLVEADCLVIEIAAHTAATESAERAIGHLREAPTTAKLRTTFATYASQVAAIVQQLDPLAHKAEVAEAAVSVRKLVTALPRLSSLADTVATTLDSALPDLRHVAAS